MSAPAQPWQLRLHRTPLAIARLAPGSPIPPWARTEAPLVSVTWNSSETSVVCPDAVVPDGVTKAGPFLAFEVEGPLDFTLTGVLSGLLGPLAEQQLSVFTVSTFDTDWILVPLYQADAATDVWRGYGHHVEEVGP